MQIINIIKLIWLFLASVAAVSGWSGLFTGSLLVGIFIAYIIIPLFSDDGINGWILGITMLAALPGGAAAMMKIFDTGADLTVKKLKGTAERILELDPMADVQGILSSCSLLENRSMSLAIRHAVIAVYVENPVLGWGASFFIPDNKEEVDECIKAIASYRDKNPDSFRALENVWTDMPDEIKQ